MRSARVYPLELDLMKHIKPLHAEADWPVWNRKIRDLLDYHAALNVIDGKLEKLASSAQGVQASAIVEHKKQSDAYRKANACAKSMIAAALSDDVYQKVIDIDSAEELREALENKLETTCTDQLF